MREVILICGQLLMVIYPAWLSRFVSHELCINLFGAYFGKRFLLMISYILTPLRKGCGGCGHMCAPPLIDPFSIDSNSNLAQAVKNENQLRNLSRLFVIFCLI